MSTRPIMTFQPDNVCVSAFTPAAPKSSCHSGASWRGSGYANCHAMNVKTRLTPQSHPLLDLEVELVWEPGELDFHAACTAGKRLQRIFVPSFQSFPPSEVKCHYHGIALGKKRGTVRHATPTIKQTSDPKSSYLPTSGGSSFEKHRTGMASSQLDAVHLPFSYQNCLANFSTLPKFG